jgi:hypothetical protein
VLQRNSVRSSATYVYVPNVLKTLACTREDCKVEKRPHLRFQEVTALFCQDPPPGPVGRRVIVRKEIASSSGEDSWNFAGSKS